MNPIDKASFLQRLLRQNGAQKTGKRPAAATQSQPSASANEAPQTGTLSFQQRIAAGLATIDPTAPNCTHKALEVYINAALLEEFGTEIANDPAFAHLLADVLETIQLSPDYDEFARFVQAELNHANR